jgi:tyrosine-protein kinase Etk/Wzc
MANGLMQPMLIKEPIAHPVLRELKEGYKLIVISLCSCLLLSMGYLYLQAPIYVADALVEVVDLVMPERAGVGFVDNTSLLASARDLLFARATLIPVIDKLNLSVEVEPQVSWLQRLTPFSDKEQPLALVSLLKVPEAYLNQPLTLVIENSKLGEYSLYDSKERQILTGKVGQLSHNQGFSIFLSELSGESLQRFRIKKRPQEDVLASLRDNLSSEYRSYPVILRLNYQEASQTKALSVLQAIIDSYARNEKAFYAKKGKNTETFLQLQLPKQEAGLIKHQEVLSQEKQKQGIANLSFQTETLLKSQILLEKQLKELALKEQRLLREYTSEHPAYLALRDTKKILLAERKQLIKKIRAIPDLEKTLLDKERLLQLEQAQMDQLKVSRELLRFSGLSYKAPVKTLDPPEIGRVTQKKSVLTVAFEGLVTGLTLGFLLIWLRRTFFTGVKTPEEVESLGLAVLANIPLAAKQREEVSSKSVSQVALLAESAPNDLSIEALRSLRSGLPFLIRDNNKIIVVTGPAPGVGKSFVSTNLAALLAKNGPAKVLLIDADLRKGTVEHYFSKHSSKGLSEYLLGARLKEVVQESHLPGLSLISQGKGTEKSSERLMNPRLNTLIAWAKSEFDWVIIDSPPIIAITDASLLSRMAGATFLVARYAKTRPQELELSCQRLKLAGCKVNGVVLNGVENR